MTQTDFSKPQRQSPMGLVVMFAYTMQQYLRGFWPLLVIMILRFDTVNKLYFFGGIFFFALVSLVIAVLRFRNFTFGFESDGRDFVITSGILEKTRTLIQRSKIQQVVIKQSLLQKLIGVYAVEVDTAGTSEAEAKIRAVSHQVAVDLKAALQQSLGESPLEETIEPHDIQDREVLAITLGGLLRYGLTANYARTFSLVIAFLATAYENLRQWQPSEEEDFENGLNVDVLEQVVLQSAFGVGFLFFAVVLVFHMGRVLLTYFNFTIVLQQRSLLVSHGLFSTQSKVVRPERVQIFAESRNFFQRKLGIMGVKIRQATAEGQQNAQSRIEVPGCTPNQKDELLRLLFGQMPEVSTVTVPHIRRLYLSLFRTIVLPLVGVLILSQFWFEPQWWAYVAVYAVLMGFVSWIRFKNYRLLVGSRFIACQSGAWDVSRQWLEVHKIQSIQTSQWFWQKKAGLGSVHLSTAGGSVSFSTARFNQINDGVNRWLYDIESGNKNWM